MDKPRCKAGDTDLFFFSCRACPRTCCSSTTTSERVAGLSAWTRASFSTATTPAQPHTPSSSTPGPTSVGQGVLWASRHWPSPRVQCELTWDGIHVQEVTSDGLGCLPSPQLRRPGLSHTPAQGTRGRPATPSFPSPLGPEPLHRVGGRPAAGTVWERCGTRWVEKQEAVFTPLLGMVRASVCTGMCATFFSQ